MSKIWLGTLIGECSAYDFRLILEERKPKNRLKCASVLVNVLDCSFFDNVQHIFKILSNRIDYMVSLPKIKLISHRKYNFDVSQLKVNAGHYVSSYYNEDSLRLLMFVLGMRVFSPWQDRQ